jgi:S1-C subfamily serine protease
MLVQSLLLLGARLVALPLQAEEDSKRLGIYVAPVSPALRSHLSLGQGKGLLVIAVKRGSLAESEGLKPHDVVLKLDGRPVEDGDPESFRKDLAKALAKPQFTLEILREGKPRSLKIETDEGRGRRSESGDPK